MGVDVSVSVATTACKHRQALEILAGGKAAMYGRILSRSPCKGGTSPPPPPSPDIEDPGSFRGGGVASDTSLLAVGEAASAVQRAVVAGVMPKSFQIVKLLAFLDE